jgi:FlaA1/EpsC-like NDP-sugar epimerase
VIVHVLVFALIYLLAFVVRFDGAVPPQMWQRALQTCGAVIAVKLAVFLLRGGCGGWWRYATLADLSVLVEAATLATAAIFLVGGRHAGDWGIPRSIYLLDWAGTILLLGGARVANRVVREHYAPLVTARAAQRVLVVGASEASLALIREVQRQPRLGLRVVGVLDGGPLAGGRPLAGVRVVGAPTDVCRAAARHGAVGVLIPVPAVPAREVRALVTACRQTTLKVQVVPGFDALLTGTLLVQPRDAAIEDLLCRDPVRLDGDAVSRFLNGRVVLVTGAAGSIGSEICRQLLSFRPQRLVLLDHCENGLFFLERQLNPLAPRTELAACVASITDRARLRATLRQHRPSVVFHCAAHKHVPMMEANPWEALRNNVLGTRQVVDESLEVNVEAFVLISTDKAVNPSSVMGATKRLAEMYVQALSERTSSKLMTVRFGNVLGSNGSVVPIFKEQIASGGPVTVTHPDMTRYFMTIPEAAQLVLQAGALGQGGEIFVLDMGRPVRVLGLARDMIRLSGLEEGRDIEIVFTGLRPGEKLFEELYDPREECLPTPHAKIFRARHRTCALDDLRARFDQWEQLGDPKAEEVIALLQQMVPEYTPRPVSGRCDATDRCAVHAAPVL